MGGKCFFILYVSILRNVFLLSSSKSGQVEVGVGLNQECVVVKFGEIYVGLCWGKSVSGKKFVKSVSTQSGKLSHS